MIYPARRAAQGPRGTDWALSFESRPLVAAVSSCAQKLGAAAEVRYH